MAGLVPAARAILSKKTCPAHPRERRAAAPPRGRGMTKSKERAADRRPRTAMHSPFIKESTMPMTPRRLRFVDEYLIDLDARAAARRAGFSPRSKNTPHKLLRE